MCASWPPKAPTHPCLGEDALRCPSLPERSLVDSLVPRYGHLLDRDGRQFPRRQFAGSARSHTVGQAVLGKRGWSGRTVPVGLRLAVQTRGELTRAQRVVCLKRLVYPGTRRQILRVVVRLKLR